MRRSIGFLSLAVCLGFIFAGYKEHNRVRFAISLAKERAESTKAERLALTTLRGTAPTLARLDKIAKAFVELANTAENNMDNLEGRFAALALGALLAFCLWVWPKSRSADDARHATETVATREAAGGNSASTAVPTGGDVDIRPDERLTFIPNAPALSNRAETNCQVCGESLLTGVVDCRECGTPHHRDCWEWNRGCSTFGCGASRFTEAKASR